MTVRNMIAGRLALLLVLGSSLFGQTFTLGSDKDPCVGGTPWQQVLRFGDKGAPFYCTFPAVPAGLYTVTLGFREPTFTTVGSRSFSASVNGLQFASLDRMDLIAMGATDPAMIITRSVPVLSDGTIRVALATQLTGKNALLATVTIAPWSAPVVTPVPIPPPTPPADQPPVTQPPVTQPPPVTSGAVVIPPDTGAIDVRAKYGAKGDGITDDTKAVQGAITECVSSHSSVVYFPAGTYLVSDSIRYIDSGGNWGAYCTLQGGGEKVATVKLKDGAFTGAPKAVIFTASAGAGNPSGNPSGGGNAAFNNHVLDLTIDTGKANPGAIGIDLLGTNNSRLSHVTVKSGDGQGVAGISVARNYSGPQLLTYVTVTGFSVGIDASGGNVSTTIEHAKLSGQSTAAIQSYGNSLFARDIVSVNGVPAVVTGEFNLTVIVDGSFTGGNGSRSAIEGGGNSAQMFARNVNAAGYQSAVKWQGAVVSGSSQAEYSSAAVQGLWPMKGTSLGLPVQEFPNYADPDLSHWINVQSMGAKPDRSDAAPGFQAAVAQCNGTTKTTIYFPHGTYRLGSTINIPAGCKRIVGYGADIEPFDASHPANQLGIVYSAASGTLVLEGLNFTNNTSQYTDAIHHTGAGTLALQSSHMDGRYVASPGAGDVHLSDMAFGAFYFASGQHAWARQLDCEGDGQHVQNGGAALWILGLTTEDQGPVATSGPGSQTEILGATILLHSGVGSDTTNYAFSSTDAQVSYAYAVTTDVSYVHQISDTRSGVKRTVDCDANWKCGTLPSRFHGVAVPLFSGW